MSERRIYREILRLLESQTPFVVATVTKSRGSVPARGPSKMVCTADGWTTGTVGGAGLEEKVKKAALELIAERRSETLHFDLANWRPGGLNSVCGGSVDVHLEYHHPPPNLLLVGGGHCAAALASLCDPLDYDYTVVDDRAGYAGRERFPGAVETFAGTFLGFAESHDLRRYSHLYLLGYSHDKDTDALEIALRRFPAVIGVIGSRAKRHSMEERLLARGFTQTQLARFRCPIGIEIQAETPEEIAVAVLGEIIQDIRAPGTAEAAPEPAGQASGSVPSRSADQPSPNEKA